MLDFRFRGNERKNSAPRRRIVDKLHAACLSVLLAEFQRTGACRFDGAHAALPAEMAVGRQRERLVRRVDQKIRKGLLAVCPRTFGAAMAGGGNGSGDCRSVKFCCCRNAST